jgi:heme/copper-type cytochrome/quinol oxidase subunit 2
VSSTAGATPYAASSPSASSGANNGLGTAALVIGIIAVLGCWTIVGGIVLGVLAIVFGFIGRGRVKRGEASNGGAATAGLALGAVGLAVAILFLAITGTFWLHHKKQINNLESCDQKATTAAQRQSCNQQFQNSVNNG